MESMCCLQDQDQDPIFPCSPSSSLASILSSKEGKEHTIGTTGIVMRRKQPQCEKNKVQQIGTVSGICPQKPARKNTDYTHLIRTQSKLLIGWFKGMDLGGAGGYLM